MNYCDTFWGSHGCDDDPGHEGTIHTCGVNGEVCSQFDSITGATRYMEYDDNDDAVELSDWWKDGKPYVIPVAEKVTSVAIEAKEVMT